MDPTLAGICYLFLIVGVGSVVGRITIKGIGLGAAAVLFLAIASSAAYEATGYPDPPEVPAALGTFGLALFTFTVGLQSGPSFFASLRRNWVVVVAMVALVAVAAAVAVFGGRLIGLDPVTSAGTFAGALTNTPALAAVLDAAALDVAQDATVGYAVAYLGGVLGILATVQLALRRRAADTDTPPELVIRTVRVEVSQGRSIAQEEARYSGRIGFTRIRHGEHGVHGPIEPADDDDTLHRNDLVTVVGPLALVEAVTEDLGHVSSHRLETDREQVDMRRIIVSRSRAAGRTIGELDLAARFGATVSRVRRGDVDRVASDDDMLQLGDRVRVVAPADQMAKVSAFFGDSARGMSDITPVLLGLGMVVGILLGEVAFPVPGGFCIGPAAGTLVIGLMLGRIGRIGPVVTAMPFTASQALAELGLLLFLAQAGSAAGPSIVTAFDSGEWVKILVLGVAVTGTFCVGLYVVMRGVFRIGGTKLSGVLSGSQTQPAALAFANDRTGYDPRVAQGYALVYPAAIVTKIILGQVLGGL
ncbi:MAG: transporter [Micrococcales bacterium]|nr:transporter [Micrococcales bacterium]MCL2668480.1 transporter [Micrococcales bacterium]